MKPNTKNRRSAQWGWFVGLWCLGLAATVTLSLLVRWTVRNLQH